MSEDALTVTATAISSYDQPPSKEMMLQRAKFFLDRRELSKSVLVEGIDEDYALVAGKKKSLLQPGADKLISLWGLETNAVILPPPESVYDHDNGYYHICARFEVINNGKVVGVGIGTASSKESKYGYRWKTKNQIENDPQYKNYNISKLRQRKGYNGVEYQVPNLDVNDLVNTLTKMAVKRGKTSAVLQALGLSHDFTTEEGDPTAQPKKQPKPKAKSKAKEEDDAAPDKDASNFVDWFNKYCDDHGWSEEAREAAERKMETMWQIPSIDKIRPDIVKIARESVERQITKYLQREKLIPED